MSFTRSVTKIAFIVGSTFFCLPSASAVCPLLPTPLPAPIILFDGSCHYPIVRSDISPQTLVDPNNPSAAVAVDPALLSSGFINLRSVDSVYAYFIGYVPVLQREADQTTTFVKTYSALQIAANEPFSTDRSIGENFIHIKGTDTQTNMYNGFLQQLAVANSGTSVFVSSPLTTAPAILESKYSQFGSYRSVGANVVQSLIPLPNQAAYKVDGNIALPERNFGITFLSQSFKDGTTAVNLLWEVPYANSMKILTNLSADGWTITKFGDPGDGNTTISIVNVLGIAIDVPTTMYAIQATRVGATATIQQSISKSLAILYPNAVAPRTVTAQVTDK